MSSSFDLIVAHSRPGSPFLHEGTGPVDDELGPLDVGEPEGPAVHVRADQAVAAGGGGREVIRFCLMDILMSTHW